MNLDVTPEAVEVLTRSLELASLDPSAHGVRLRVTKSLGGAREVQVELAETPASGEQVVEAGGLRLFVDPEVGELYPRPVVAVEPQHERVVVRNE